MAYEIENYAPPLKKELPLLQYDIALYCSKFCELTDNVWPDYLVNFREKVTSYSKQLKRLKPLKRDIPPDIRIYILDHRLNLLFAALDDTGRMATYFSQFCVQYKHGDIEKHYYGDGAKAFDEHPFQQNGELCFRPDPQEIYEFNKLYGFVPSELFAAPTVLFFQGIELCRIDSTTMEHCVLLMEKFHSKNIVDIKSILQDVQLFDPIVFY